MAQATPAAGKASPATLTAAHVTHRRRARTTTVRQGEGFWTIAQRTHTDWHALAEVNGMTLESMLHPGQVLHLPEPGQAATSSEAGTSAPAAPPTTSAAGSSDGSATTYASPGSAFESCVIQRESNGNAEVVNGSGHWGLYQFSQSLWTAYGGSAATFGNASAGEQQQMFDRVVAAGGASNWSAYDGC